MLIKQTDKAKIYIPESEAEKKELEQLAEKGIVDYHDGGYFITDESVEFIVRKLL